MEYDLTTHPGRNFMVIEKYPRSSIQVGRDFFLMVRIGHGTAATSEQNLEPAKGEME
jgi:hypothetical protein